MAQMNILVGFDPVTLQALDEYCKTTNRKRNEVVREAVRGYISMPENSRKRFIPKRIANALHIFKILKFMTKNDSEREDYSLVYNDVLVAKFGRWHIALTALAVFGNICSSLQHPVIIEEKIEPLQVPGINRYRMNRVGFEVHFESPITLDKLVEMEKKAIELTSKSDFIDKVTFNASTVIKASQKQYLDTIVDNLVTGEVVDMEDDNGDDDGDDMVELDGGE